MPKREVIPTGYWYLSFAGDEGHRGVVIVKADDLLEAVAETNRLGLNPHGEVLGVALPEGFDDYVDWRPHINKLLQLEDLRRMGWEPVSTETGEPM